MSRGSAVRNRSSSLPIVKKEPAESGGNAQIMNLTSIFSSPSSMANRRTLSQIKEEPGMVYVTKGTGVTPSGLGYSPMVEKSPNCRPQVGPDV